MHIVVRFGDSSMTASKMWAHWDAGMMGKMWGNKCE